MNPTYYDRIDGWNVWVTVERPLIRKGEKFVEAPYWMVSFKFDAAPGILTGEYLKNENGEIRGFESQAKAADAGFKEATRRIKARAGK